MTRGPDPAWHRCTIGELDYTLVDHGTIRCAPERGGCGRTWHFVAEVGWAPSPRPVAPLRSGSRRVTSPAPTTGVGPW